MRARDHQSNTCPTSCSCCSTSYPFCCTQKRQLAATDALLRERFLGLTSQAIAGELGRWSETPQGGLALVLLLDQLPASSGLAVQEASLPLFRQFVDPRTADFAIRHRDVIAQFGRFPHRNAALGRVSSAEELAFLQTPGSGF